MGGSSTHIDTVELLMRGVSEEEQLAMAIAMSMQDAQQQQDVVPVNMAEDEGHVQESEGETIDNSSSSSESSSSESSSSGSSSSDSGNDGLVSLGENEEEVIFSSGEDLSLNR
jgi:hypothetical protein